MNKKRYAAEQIVAIWKHTKAGTPIAGLICEARVSEETSYMRKDWCTSLRFGWLCQL